MKSRNAVLKLLGGHFVMSKWFGPETMWWSPGKSKCAGSAVSISWTMLIIWALVACLWIVFVVIILAYVSVGRSPWMFLWFRIRQRWPFSYKSAMRHIRLTMSSCQFRAADIKSIWDFLCSCMIPVHVLSRVSGACLVEDNGIGQCRRQQG